MSTRFLVANDLVAQGIQNDLTLTIFAVKNNMAIDSRENSRCTPTADSAAPTVLQGKLRVIVRFNDNFHKLAPFHCIFPIAGDLLALDGLVSGLQDYVRLNHEVQHHYCRCPALRVAEDRLAAETAR